MRRVGLFLVLVGCSEVDVVDGSGGGGGASVSAGESVSASTSTSTSGSTSTTGTGGPFCGDGAVDSDEECDDGNVIDGDACSAGCVVECEPLEPFSNNETVYKDPSTFHCYRWTNGPWKTGPDGCSPAFFVQAQANCEQWSGDLAALSTLAERDAVIAAGFLYPFTPDILLGAQDMTGMGDWVWLNGEPWTYAAGMAPWLPGEPTGGIYLEMFYDGSFNAEVQGSSCSWLCERWPAGIVPPP